MANIPTVAIVIASLPFDCPQPYAEGHVCSAAEARVLNMALAENLRNNFAKRIKAMRDRAASADEFAGLQAEFTLYASQYSFTNAGELKSLTIDPLMEEALRIARGQVKALYLRRSLDPKEDRAKFEANVRKVALLPKVQAEAKKRLDALARAGEELFSGLSDEESAGQRLADAASESRGME
jgi:hypothetical protein